MYKVLMMISMVVLLISFSLCAPTSRLWEAALKDVKKLQNIELDMSDKLYPPKIQHGCERLILKCFQDELDRIDELNEIIEVTTHITNFKINSDAAMNITLIGSAHTKEDKCLKCNEQNMTHPAQFLKGLEGFVQWMISRR